MFSDDVMDACEMIFPAKCKSDLEIEVGGGSAQTMTPSQVVGWMSTMTMTAISYVYRIIVLIPLCDRLSLNFIAIV